MEAAKRALAAAGATPTDVDLIIVATTTPDLTFPATATIVQRKLGMPIVPGLRRAGGLLRLRLRARRWPTASSPAAAPSAPW